VSDESLQECTMTTSLTCTLDRCKIIGGLF